MRYCGPVSPSILFLPFRVLEVRIDTLYSVSVAKRWFLLEIPSQIHLEITLYRLSGQCFHSHRHTEIPCQHHWQNGEQEGSYLGIVGCSATSGLCSLGTTHPHCDNRKCLRALLMFSGGNMMMAENRWCNATLRWPREAGDSTRHNGCCSSDGVSGLWAIRDSAVCVAGARLGVQTWLREMVSGRKNGPPYSTNPVAENTEEECQGNPVFLEKLPQWRLDKNVNSVVLAEKIKNCNVFILRLHE